MVFLSGHVQSDNLFDVLGHPTEALAISLAQHNRAHKYFNGANVGRQLDLTLASGVGEAEGMTQVLLRNGAGQVNLVAKNQERNFGELFNAQKTLKQLNTLRIDCISDTSSSALDSASLPRSWVSTRKTIPAASGK